jgi:predicted Zn finger-like uncharacterized protein
MNITCPHCDFSRTVEPNKVPDRPVKVKCPKCQEGFTFNKAEQARQPKEQVNCPACGLVQDKNNQCGGCGVIYEKFKDRQQSNVHDEMNGNLAALRQLAQDEIAPHLKSKAGFWVRFIAYMLDSFLIGIVQLILGFLIGLVIGMMGVAVEGDPAISTVLWLFGIALSLGYAVFFTGYCGQTPGKMALRIKVIRTDGSEISYGRAALREIPGKFISSILLAIGYIMVAFDRHKQGLHDKIADTYVIKL